MFQWRNIVLFSVGCASVFAASDIPSYKSFFLLNQALATKISRTFNVVVKPGLYFSDQGKEFLSHEFRGVQYRIKLKNEDARYLVVDEFPSHLYGESRWRSYGMNRIKRVDGKVQVTPVPRKEEFAVDVGFIKRLDPSSLKLVDQLWLSRKNGERWLLHQQERSNHFLFLPTFFMPIKNGVIAFADDWIVSRKNFQQKVQFKFPTKLEGAKNFEDCSCLVALGNEGEDRTKAAPLLSFNSTEEKILFAGWCQTKEFKAVKNVLANGEEAPLFMWDLKTDRITQIHQGLQWSFFIGSERVFELRKRGLYSAEIDWGEDGRRSGIGAFTRFDYDRKYILTVSPNGIIKKPRRRSSKEPPTILVGKTKTGPLNFKAIDSKVLTKFESWGYPSDVMTELRLGERQPNYYLKRVARDLASVLNRQRSWALLLYQRGDRPRELVASAFHAMDIDKGDFEVPLSLKLLDSVFLFEASLFSGRYKVINSLKEGLSSIRQGIEGTRAIAYFQDFPTDNIERFLLGRDPDAVSPLVDRMKVFSEEFGKCISNGKCRIITTLHYEAYDAINATEDGQRLFRLATRVQPNPRRDFSESNRKKTARLFAQKYEKEFNISLSDGAFEKAWFFLKEVLVRDGERIPGFYDTWFLGLFSQANLGRKTKIDAALVVPYAAKRANRFQLVEDRPQGKKERSLYWVREVDGERQGAEAVSKLHKRVWQDDKTLLKSSSRFPLAVLRIPGTYKDKKKYPFDNNPGEQGAIDVLIAPNQTIRALEFMIDSDEIALHPNGFYYLFKDEKNIWLRFFDVRQVGLNQDPNVTLKPTDTEVPIPLVDYKRKLIRFNFKNDRVEVVREGAKTEVYGTTGRIEWEKENVDD